MQQQKSLKLDYIVWYCLFLVLLFDTESRTSLQVAIEEMDGQREWPLEKDEGRLM